MRLLIVIHEFPPARSPRAYRWGAIAEKLARDGHEIDVVCSQRPGLATPKHGTLRVVGVGNCLTARLREKLSGRSAGASSPRSRPDRPVGSRPDTLPAKLASWAYYRLWKPVYWPDAQCMFIVPALWTAWRLLLANRYDALITVSLPFCCHLVGLALKRRNPNLPWIVDIGDPFALLHDIPLNNHRLYSRLNRAVEAAVLLAADRIAMTTPGALEHYQREFTFDAEKVAIIPPLLSLPDGLGLSSEHAPWGRLDAALRMVYCGRVYSDIRSPAYLLKLLRRLTELTYRRVPELHFFGSLGDCEHVFEPYRDLLDRHLFIHGEVDRATVAAALRSADLLVNIGNATSHQVPSKIVEYIGVGKPILNLVSHERDCSLEMLAEYPTVLNLRCHRETFDENVWRMVQLIERLPIAIPRETLRALQAPFLPDAIATAYLQLASTGQASWPWAGSGLGRVQRVA